MQITRDSVVVMKYNSIVDAHRAKKDVVLYN